MECELFHDGDFATHSLLQLAALTEVLYLSFPIPVLLARL